MEKIGDMDLYSQEEVMEMFYGPIGTPKRDAFEAKLKDELEAFHIGEAIKQTRLGQQLTQKQLGERMGVQESAISKIESGKSITYATLVRAFKALGAKTATLDLGNLGRVALW
jgi:DNA-binding XRE family transcriptional regulator